SPATSTITRCRQTVRRSLRFVSTSPTYGDARCGGEVRRIGRPRNGPRGWPTIGSQNRESFTPGRMRALQSDTQGGSRMPELGPYGSVRGAKSNLRPLYVA